MAFGSMAPGLMPVDTTFQPNQMMKMGTGLLQQAQAAQRQPGGAGQGILQRLLNPQAPPPTDLAAPGMPSNGGAPAPGGNPMQMGMLGRLFPGLGAPGAPPVMPQGDPTAGLGGLY